MKRSLDGGIVIGASRPKYYSRTHKKQTLADLRMGKLKNYLCSCGPKMCARCKLCEYGKEYIRRMQVDKI